MKAVFGSVASEFKSLPRPVDKLFLDDGDMYGLLWWYDCARRMCKAAKENAGGVKGK